MQDVAARVDISYSAENIRGLLESSNPNDNFKGLGSLIGSEFPIEPFVDLVDGLLSNDRGNVAHLSVRDVASMVLAVRGVKPYDGSSVLVAHYVDQLTKRRS